MKIKAWANVLKNAIELVGRHPLVTGILAIIGLLGFLFSIYTFEQDRLSSIESGKQQERNIETISSVDKGVQAISKATFAACAKAPCWTLRELVSSDTIGKPKDIIDAKVGPAVRKDKGQFVYDLDGCFVSIEYTDDAVSYFSARLFKYVEDGNRKDPYGYPVMLRKPCDFSVDQFFDVSGRRKITDNANVTIADLLGLAEPAATCNGCSAPALHISSACLDCGNYAEPFIEFMQFGSHAQNFTNTFFSTLFDPPDAGGDEGYTILDNFRSAMRGKIADADYNLEIAPLCSVDVYPDASKLLARAQVTEVGLGVGPRVWSNVLFCKWWE